MGAGVEAAGVAAAGCRILQHCFAAAAAAGVDAAERGGSPPHGTEAIRKGR